MTARFARDVARLDAASRNLAAPRAERRRIQQPRQRREYFGKLKQIQGSDHRCFEDRGGALHFRCSSMTPPAD